MDAIRFIVAGNFIDGSGAAMRRNIFLAIENGRISAIGPAKLLSRNDEAPIDAFPHCTIVPALVDCSISLARSAATDSRVRSAAEKTGPAGTKAMVEQHILYCQAHGVLGVAVCDDIADLFGLNQARTARGNSIDIRTPGRLRPGRQDCRAGNLADGDFLRVTYSGNIEDDKAPHIQLTYENLGRILENRGGRKAVVLANGGQQVKEALAAGCDAIEQGYGMGENNLRKMAEKNVLWIPSLLRAKNRLDSASTGGDVGCRFSHRYAAPGKPDPDAKTYWEKMLSGQLAQLRFARKIGLKTAVGTGAGSVGILHGESMVEEMKLFLKAGYSLEETIQCASENGARFFSMAKLGRLSVGREATFLVARGSATQLPRKLSYLTAIYLNGELATE